MTSELETKVAEAIWEARRAPEQSPWAELHPSVRDGVLTGARAAIATMRAHCGYEAAARECERLAGEAGKRNTAHGHGEQHAYADAARIIREHGQHAPTVDREGLALLFANAFNQSPSTVGLSADEMDAVRAGIDAILAHLGAQPAPPSASGARGWCGRWRMRWMLTRASW